MWIMVIVIITTIYIVSLRHIILLENRNIAAVMGFSSLIGFL